MELVKDFTMTVWREKLVKREKLKSKDNSTKNVYIKKFILKEIIVVEALFKPIIIIMSGNEQTASPCCTKFKPYVGSSGSVLMNSPPS